MKRKAEFEETITKQARTDDTENPTSEIPFQEMIVADTTSESETEFSSESDSEKGRKRNRSEDSNDSSSSIDSTEATPQGKRCKNAGEEFDDLYYSPSTPVNQFIGMARQRSDAIDINDSSTSIRRCPAFDDFRDISDNLSTGSSDNSPASIVWTPTTTNHDDDRDDANVNGLASLLEAQVIETPPANLMSLSTPNQTNGNSFPIVAGLQINFDDYSIGFNSI